MYGKIILITIVVTLLYVGFALTKRNRKQRLHIINERRAFLDREGYIKRLTDRGFDAHHAQIIHDQIRAWIGMEQFSIYPEDDINRIYGLTMLDNETLLDYISKALGLRFATASELEALSKGHKYFNAVHIARIMQKYVAEQSTTQ